MSHVSHYADHFSGLFAGVKGQSEAEPRAEGTLLTPERMCHRLVHQRDSPTSPGILPGEVSARKNRRAHDCRKRGSDEFSSRRLRLAPNQESTSALNEE